MRNYKVHGLEKDQFTLNKEHSMDISRLCLSLIPLTVSIPIALIWSALFSVIDKNFFGSDKASTISVRKKKSTFCELWRHLEISILQKLYSILVIIRHGLQQESSFLWWIWQDWKCLFPQHLEQGTIPNVPRCGINPGTLFRKNPECFNFLPVNDCRIWVQGGISWATKH